MNLAYACYAYNLSKLCSDQVSLEQEKQNCDDWKRKYTEAQESGEESRRKLEETEKRVHQLQESLKG